MYVCVCVCVAEKSFKRKRLNVLLIGHVETQIINGKDKRDLILLGTELTKANHTDYLCVPVCVIWGIW